MNRCNHFSPNFSLTQLLQHEEAEAAFAQERSQRVPEKSRAATDMMKFQDTPNPNSLKFVPGCPVLGVGGGTLDLPTARAAMVIRNAGRYLHALPSSLSFPPQVSPLAKAIFRVDDVSGEPFLQSCEP